MTKAMVDFEQDAEREAWHHGGQGMDTYNIPPQIWLVAFQLGLNAVGWCLAVRWLPEERRAIGQWAMFMAFLSLGLVLTGLRVTTADRPWLLYNGVTVVSLIGFGLMRRGTEHFVRSGCRDRTQAWLVLPPLLATLIIPPTLAWAPLRTCYAFAVQAVIMLSMARSIAPPMRREFGVAATRGLVLPLTVIGLLQVALAVRQALTWASPQEIHLDTGYNQGVLYLYLAGSAVFGFGFMYLVALRLTHQLRLAS